MQQINFAIGFACGLLDMAGWIKARDRIYGATRPSGRKTDGFDCALDLFFEARQRRRDRQRQSH